MKLKRNAIFLVCILLIPLLTSCNDAKELDEWAYAYTLGVDKGEAANFRLTVQLPTFKQSAAGGGGGSSGSQSKSGDFSVITVDCPSLYTGLNSINTSLSRTLNMTHCQFILISEDLAKKDIGFVCDAIVRDRQIRRPAHLIIVKGQASKFIESFNPVVGTAISKTQEGQMQQINATGLAGNSTLGEFLNNVKSTTTQPFAALASLNEYSSQNESSSASSSSGPSSGSSSESSGGSSSSSPVYFLDYLAGEIPRKGGNKTEFTGTALFDGGKMVGELTGGETQAMMIMRGSFQTASLALQDPLETELTDTIKLRQLKSPRVSVNTKISKPTIELELFLAADLQQVQSRVGQDDVKLIPLLEKEFKKELNSKINETFKICKNKGCDVFGFGGKAVTNFATIQQWERYSWLSKFKDATLKTTVNFDIKRNGALLKNNPVEGAGSSESSGGASQ